MRTTTTGRVPLTLEKRLVAAAPGARRALHARLRAVLDALDVDPGAGTATELLGSFDGALRDADPSSVWLSLAVLDGALPTAEDVRRTVRAIRLDGVSAAFGGRPVDVLHGWLTPRRTAPEVRVLRGAVLVDLEHTARAGLATGIQRVARETSRRWVRDHDVHVVGWGADHEHLRLLRTDERERALTGSALRTDAGGEAEVVVVPWRSTYLLPELSPERERNARIAALAEFGGGRTGVIGFDCVPISTAETTALGVSEAFATNLAAVRHMDRVSTISEAAATEYRGWRSMLTSIGAAGPEIGADLLPAEVPEATAGAVADVRARWTLPGLPMVLCVGTHEPRKNHVALLHAAELLWREGVRFSLVLVGGRAWNDAPFQEAVAAARSRNRPLDVVTSMSDDALWAAYRVARCVVFPSLNEGFGLPVAESLASGTPVVTSRYGSMAEIAAAGGAVVVDPRDDHDIAAGLRRVLTDDAVHADLVRAARARPVRTWDDYAQDVWSRLAE